jgi:hypothetical protein
MIKAKQHYKQHYKSIAKAFTACSLVSKLYTRVHQCREKNKNQINLLSTLGIPARVRYYCCTGTGMIYDLW